MLIQTLRSHDLNLAKTAFQHRPYCMLSPSGTHRSETHLHQLTHAPQIWCTGPCSYTRGEERLSLPWCWPSQSPLTLNGDTTYSLLIQTKATKMQEVASSQVNWWGWETREIRRQYTLELIWADRKITRHASTRAHWARSRIHWKNVY